MKTAIRLGLVLALAGSLPPLAQAAELPSAVIPEGVGINIHFSKGNEKDLDMIAAAGIKVVRTDFQWDKTELYRGVYDWSAYDELASNLIKRGMRPYFILDYSNQLYADHTPKLWANLWHYNEVMSPRSPESIAAFSRWAAAAANHFKNYKVIWEIWNEPNIKFWKPRPNVAEYSQLAISACKAVHAADANATVLAPAASNIPWDFLENLFKTGILDCLDAVSVHPYRPQVPETVTDDYVRLRKLVDRYTPAQRGQKIPILSGEWGYTSLKRGLSPTDQAFLAVRMQLINLLNGVPLSIWYDWKNDGVDPASSEQNFGIVMADLVPKPAYIALKTMTTELAGYRLVQRLNLGKDNDYALLFANAQKQVKIAVWTSVAEHDTRIPLPPPHPAKLSLTDWQGARSEIRFDGNWLPVRLTHSPSYIAP